MQLVERGNNHAKETHKLEPTRRKRKSNFRYCVHILLKLKRRNLRTRCSARLPVMKPKILITPKRVNQSIHQPESMFVVRYYIVLNLVVKVKAVYKGEKGIYAVYAPIHFIMLSNKLVTKGAYQAVLKQPHHHYS